MLSPPELLALTARRGRELEAEAAAERLRPLGRSRRRTAAILRGVADRLAPAPPAAPALEQPAGPSRWGRPPGPHRVRVGPPLRADRARERRRAPDRQVRVGDCSACRDADPHPA